MPLKNRKPDDIASWLEQLGQPSADRDYKPGHQRMHDLLAPFNLKRPSLRIRIAGTNGKGSTATMLSNALQACSLKVGLYTSPHLHHFNERIRINGKPLLNSALLTIMEEIMPIALEIDASYFEVATALALKHFNDSEVDVEILEAGVGARLDATTAVDADMALITPIGLDHQAWLGDSLTDIAKEKAYITDGCQLSISTNQTAEVTSILLKQCQELCFVEGKAFTSIKAIGEHQKQNASLAWEAVQTLASAGMIRSDMLDAAKAAIEETEVPGRLQKAVLGEANLWLDAAHNAHAIDALLPTLSSLAGDLFTAVFIYTREDRDLTDSIDLLRPFTNRVIGGDENIFDKSYPTIEMALEGELREQPQGNYLILGSFVTVAAALDWIEKNRPSV
ncbi:MAG: Mur ligase family protein [Mariprofundaceae bacterium]